MKLPFHDKKFLFLLFAVVLVVLMEILSIAGIHIPMPYEPFLFGAFIIGFGHQVLWNGLKALVKMKFSSINLLMTIAVVAAFYLGEYPEAAVVIVLYTLGETLEEVGIRNSKNALNELVSKAPKTAKLKETGEEVPIQHISVGSIILIKPGDYIPLDGKITNGTTTVDEAAITGEPIPKDKHPGDFVFAGTINKNGAIEVEATKEAKDTTLSKIIRLTFEATANKSKTQKFIQQFSRYYTPSILVLASLVFAIPVFLNHQPMNTWLQQAITLLVIACPCALVISTPVAIYAAIGNASSKGVLIKGGKFVELLAQVKAIALDKTRTITYGKPVVSDLIPIHVRDNEELLACAAGAEVFSEHPLADAIVDAAKKDGHHPHAVENFRSVPGKGAIAECLVCEDETIFIGKLSFIREYQPVTEEAEKIVERLSDEGKTSVVVSFGDGVAGIIGLMDEIKPDSHEALQEIKAMDITPVMLTGDSQKTAHYVASQVGIQDAYGALLPEGKAEKMDELLAQYKTVAMVGDGINDAPALAKSSVGIAMGAAGSDTAIETADIALMNDKLSVIPFLIRLSKKTLLRIKINTIGAIVVKLVFIILAFLGYSNMVFAIAADVGVTLVVILFSLSLLSYGDNARSEVIRLDTLD